MSQIIIGTKTFKFKAECERYTRSLLTEMDLTESMKDRSKEYFEYFLLLCKRNPNYEDKFKNFKDFQIGRDILNKKRICT